MVLGWRGRRAGRSCAASRSRVSSISRSSDMSLLTVVLGHGSAWEGYQCVRGSKPERQLEPVRAHQLVVGEHVAGRAVGDHDPVAEHDRARAQLERVGQVVGDHQHRHVERAQDVGELAARGGVEVGRRLVEHQDLRLHRQHGGDRDPAALAEGQVVRRPVGEVGHADPVERVHRPGASSSAPAHAEVGRPERDVLADGRHEQLVVGVLEDDADPAPDLARGSPCRPAARRPRPCPAPAVRMPLRCSTSVVLPAPLGPSSATRSPRWTCRSTPNSAWWPSG